MELDNLTIQRIPPLVDVAVKQKLKALVDLAVDKTGFAREWRNRRLAHMALPPLPGDVANPLANAIRQHVEDSVPALSGPFHN
jgi:hypothetical protein